VTVEKSRQVETGVSVKDSVGVLVGIIGVRLAVGRGVAEGVGGIVGAGSVGVSPGNGVGVGRDAWRASSIRVVRTLSNPGRPGPIPKYHPNPARVNINRKVSIRRGVMIGFR
jgi:hypothetical protein